MSLIPDPGIPQSLFPINVAVLGTPACGKSALCIRFALDTFPSTYVPTIEETFARVLNLESCDVSLTVTDTAGALVSVDSLDISGRLHLPPEQIDCTTFDGFVLVFAVDDSDSFRQLRAIWNVLLASRPGRPPPPVVVVAAKNDLECVVDMPSAEDLVYELTDSAYRVSPSSPFVLSSKTAPHSVVMAPFAALAAAVIAATSAPSFVPPQRPHPALVPIVPVSLPTHVLAIAAPPQAHPGRPPALAAVGSAASAGSPSWQAGSPWAPSSAAAAVAANAGAGAAATRPLRALPHEDVPASPHTHVLRGGARSLRPPSVASDDSDDPPPGDAGGAHHQPLAAALSPPPHAPAQAAAAAAPYTADGGRGSDNEVGGPDVGEASGEAPRRRRKEGREGKEGKDSKDRDRDRDGEREGRSRDKEGGRGASPKRSRDHAQQPPLPAGQHEPDIRMPVPSALAAPAPPALADAPSGDTDRPAKRVRLDLGPPSTHGGDLAAAAAQAARPEKSFLQRLCGCFG